MSDIYFEYIRKGSYVKVTAFEPELNIEAVVVLPANLSQEQMQYQALKKLNYLLQKLEENS